MSRNAGTPVRGLAVATIDSRPHQVGDQVTEVEPGGGHRERHGRGLGEPGGDVDLEEPDPSVGVDDQVGAGQVAQAEGLVGGDRDPGALGGQLVGELGRAR